jgi:hydroxyacylglutathione hydrolase
MKITPLGVGGAFSHKWFHNNYLFDLRGPTLLIDAGTTLRYSLKEAQLHYLDVNYIFITHFHFDHVGGLEELLQRCYWNFELGKHKPHRPVLLMMEQQVPLFNQVLSPGLLTQGLRLTDYCHVEIIRNDRYTIGNYEVELVDTSNLHCEGMQGYAFKVTDRQSGSNLVFSSDIKRIEKSGLIDKLDSQTKAIFQDLQGDPVHCDLQQVLAYYPESCHSIIYAMHYSEDIERHRATYQSKGVHILEQGVPIHI